MLDCYGQHFLQSNKDSRRKALKEKYFFECQCEACTSDWSSTLPCDTFDFKCIKCFKPFQKDNDILECTSCSYKTDIKKLYSMLHDSIKNRLNALSKMYDGNYSEALPLLLEHANYIEKILVVPNLEAVKTQQSIIQCFNAISVTVNEDWL